MGGVDPYALRREIEALLAGRFPRCMLHIGVAAQRVWAMATGQASSMGKLLWGLCVVALPLSTPAVASMIEGFPDVVICRAGAMRTIGYLHRVLDDGSAVYMALGGEFATVTPDRILHRDGAEDCDGKSLEQLERDGQTRETYESE